MPLYELVLRYGDDREELRLTGRPPSVGETREDDAERERRERLGLR